MIITGSLIIHYVEVLPFLQRRKEIGIVSWLFNIRDVQDLEKYGEYCLKEGKPLTWYKLLSKAHMVIILWLVGWLLLMVSFSIFD